MLDSDKKVVRLISISSPPSTLGLTAVASPQFELQSVKLAASDPPWAAAYDELLRRGGEQYLEAEVPLEVPFQRLPARQGEERGLLGETRCTPQQRSRAAPAGQHAGWHLGDTFSQLDTARDYARKNNSLGRRVRIAHIDTGYDKTHRALPPADQILRDLSRDFTKTPPAQFADDPGGAGFPLDNSGHGTATLCLLAGGAIDLLKGSMLKSRELGGAPDVEILPLRVSERVVLIGTESLAKAVHYAIDQKCDVVTLSMGGVASKFWVDAYNRAYENGIFCVAAAGNHLKVGELPATPDSTVYPALLNRVIAATGVMADQLPYDLPGTMSGNWGPHDKMRTALAAYTPNVPWAEFECLNVLSENGAGTSAAAPQIAAAAALWLQVHGSKYDKSKDWRRAEAIRQALLQSAKSQGTHYDELGRGILQAMAALHLVPEGFIQEPPDAIWFPWLKTIVGLGVQETAAPSGPVEQMLHVEYAQLALTDPILMAMVKPGSNALSLKDQNHVRDYLVDPKNRLASSQLKYYLTTGQATAKTPAKLPPPPHRHALRPEEPAWKGMRLPWTPPVPRKRRLRIYALDPSYALQQSTVALSQFALEVPWDPNLEPGPVDEYLEVIDYDPASGCLYEPVDLTDKMLVVQDGLNPSPGNPRFHQQMAYAVARKTIDIFESALGRRIFWTGPPLGEWNKGTIDKETLHRYVGAADDNVFVQRLRVYPHALRQPNAFYSQRKGALLFGYFPSQDEDRFGDEIVYACLSYDIVAHETTHAILDGMNRTLVYPTNPDVLAFHEAFADIVALLSRFQMKEIVASQIAATRGNLNSANILGQLGREFGIGTGRFQSLRAYLGRYMEEFEPITRRNPISRYATDEEIAEAVKKAQRSPTFRRAMVWQKSEPDPRMLEAAEDPHDLGAILVAAVYGALVSIYETRAANLLRLASAEDRNGALPPELVTLLADQLSRSAAQVLQMCIRAIDYLPPTDITFGEYLRAILTADFDLVPDDPLHYRVSFIESFRNWGIKLPDVKSAAEDSLLWQKLDPGPYLTECNQLGTLLAEFVREDFQYASSRRDSFRVTYKWRWRIFDWLRETFAKRPGFDRLFGLDLSLPKAKFYPRTLRRVERTGPGGRPVPQAVLQITQTRSISEADGGTSLTSDRRPFVMGGATLVVNTSTPGVDYVILKDVGNKDRDVSAVKTAVALEESSLRATYFGMEGDRAEPFAIIHEPEDD